MSYSYTLSDSTTFTLTHAKHISAKVATDLKRMQRFYKEPIDSHIASYETEVIELLKAGYLDTVIYGFQRNGNWVEPTLIYKAKDFFGASADDDDPGRIRPGADVIGAKFGSYLTYSTAWGNLSETEKENFEERLPFKRNGASQPGVNGYLREDRIYSAGGRSLSRSSIRSY
jgi:hypothetical protein